MALYKVVRDNPYFKRFAWVEDVEQGCVQECTVVEEHGRQIPMYSKGLAVPLDLVRDALLQIKARGLDRRGLRG